MIQCKDCKFWIRSKREENPDIRECRAKAPVSFPTGAPLNITTWPLTRGSDGCEEGKEKKDGEN